jgi:hypothetical protein
MGDGASITVRFFEMRACANESICGNSTSLLSACQARPIGAPFPASSPSRQLSPQERHQEPAGKYRWQKSMLMRPHAGLLSLMIVETTGDSVHNPVNERQACYRMSCAVLSCMRFGPVTPGSALANGANRGYGCFWKSKAVVVWASKFSKTT